MHDDGHEGGIDLEAAVIFDEAKLLELVHEEVHAETGRTEYFDEYVSLEAGASGIVRRLAARRNRSRTPGPWGGRLGWFLSGVDLPLVVASFAEIEQ